MHVVMTILEFAPGEKGFATHIGVLRGSFFFE